ncbi:hypothetical protein [Pedobacter alpinus]|uniref:Uncharacterized protein n=1 Tax=Pedobacter alpinus TaxID=1590643 RepID=A0ABW5TTW9_9SPHI
MTSKETLHQFIDEIEDENLLRGYLGMIKELNQQQTGKLFNSLTVKEQQELIFSYEESFNPGNLISNQEVKNKYSKTNSLDKKRQLKFHSCNKLY